MTAPETLPTMRRVTFETKGGQMAGVAFGLEKPTPDLVFLHATGFNALTYRTMLAPLGARYHVLALDLRGHGRTQLPARLLGYTSWRGHARDVGELLERHFRRPVTLAGHSFGAMVSLFVTARMPEVASSLALIEPVIAPALTYAVMELPGSPLIMRGLFPIARAAGRRRGHFASREAALGALADRGVFKAFPREVVVDYLEDGLREDNKGVALSCRPAYEAATFAAQRHNPWAALRRVRCPLVVLKSSEGSTVRGGAMKHIAAIRPDALIGVVEGGHMLPMERPDRVRSALESAILLGRGGSSLQVHDK